MILVIVSVNDEQKIEAIYLTYAGPLLYYIRSILRDEHLAEDALQNTLFQVMKNIDKVEDVQSIRTKNYLYVIARNIAYKFYNEKKKENDVTKPYDESIITMMDEFQVQQSIAQAQPGAQLDECIADLSESDRDIISLKYGMGLEDGEIARMLQIKQDAVRQRLSRAKKRLALIIEQKREEV